MITTNPPIAVSKSHLAGVQVAELDYESCRVAVNYDSDPRLVGSHFQAAEQVDGQVLHEIEPFPPDASRGIDDQHQI